MGGNYASVVRSTSSRLHSINLLFSRHNHAFHRPRSPPLRNYLSCTHKLSTNFSNCFNGLKHFEKSHVARQTVQPAVQNFSGPSAWNSASIGFRGSSCHSRSILCGLCSVPNGYGMNVSRHFSSGPSDDVRNKLSTEVSSLPDNQGSAMYPDSVLNAAKSVTEAVKSSIAHLEMKLNEMSQELMPMSQQLLDSHPFLKDIILPASSTAIGALFAWLIMPRMLRRLHRYSWVKTANEVVFKTANEVVYEKSFWGALEDPIRYLFAFLAVSQFGSMIAPNIVSQYLAQVWRGATVLSVLWFLQRWKRNVFSRTSPQLIGLDKDTALALDKISSVALFVLGGLTFAEASGIAVQSVLTVGGVGGIAAAIAARDILGNTITGLSLQLSHPFSVGDTIKAGTVEGKVIEIGLMTTTLLSPEKFTVIVPNSQLSSQVIINKSRALCHLLVAKVPIRISAFEMVPKITKDIEDVLSINKKVVFEPEKPQCFVSQIGSVWELTVNCNVQPMSKRDLYLTQQEILLDTAKIVKDNGAELFSHQP